MTPKQKKEALSSIKYYESNSGLGHGELSYFAKINKTEFVCVGYSVYENDPPFSLGEIITLSSDWKYLDKHNCLMRDEFSMCKNPEILINQDILSLIVFQSNKIKKLTEELYHCQFKSLPKDDVL